MSDDGVFRRWLAEQFRADPVSVGKYAATACRPVRVTRRWWRGQRVMDAQAEVKLGVNEVAAGARTQPRWRLIPDDMKLEFQKLDRAVDRVVSRYTVDGDDAVPLALGDGVYVIDAAELPDAQRRLSELQEAWGRSADRWTTEDGYARLHEQLAAQMGDASYKEAKALVPDRHRLRAAFGLIVRPLAVRLVPDAADDPATRAAVEGNTVALLAAAVVRPREQLAAGVSALAGRLCEPDAAAGFRPLKPTRTVAGAAREVSRTVTADAVAAARRAVDEFAPYAPRTDPRLRHAWGAAAAELPAEGAPDALAAVAARLKVQDADALRVGIILTKVAEAARDETGMCEEFALRRRPEPPAIGPEDA